MRPDYLQRRRVIWPFQSSPGLEAGCDGTAVRLVVDVRSVSILTRLGGRVRLYWASIGVSLPLFQSSPGLEAGCDFQPDSQGGR